MDSPRSFGVSADGTNILSPVNTSNYFNGDASGFTGPGVLLSAAETGFAVPNYGVNVGFRDQGRRISTITFAHFASTLVLNFFYTNGVSGRSDESFGIDNIVVSDDNSVPQTGAVPEPTTIALTATASTSRGFSTDPYCERPTVA